MSWRFNEALGGAADYRGLVEAFSARCAALDVATPHPLATLVRELGIAVTTLENEAGITGRWPMS